MVARLPVLMRTSPNCAVPDDLNAQRILGLDQVVEGIIDRRGASNLTCLKRFDKLNLELRLVRAGVGRSAAGLGARS